MTRGETSEPVQARPDTSRVPFGPVVVCHELRHRDGRRLWIYGDLRGEIGGEEVEPIAPFGLHQRYDALTDTWVAVSPGRNIRPNVPAADHGGLTACPLCPGGPEVPFSYEAAVFENRFPSLVADPPAVPPGPGFAPARGRCEVVLYTESHTGSLATLTPEELARVIAIWRDRTAALWAEPAHRFVMAFENRGEAVGATISHPHGQIYAFDRLPPYIAGRLRALELHRASHGSCLGCVVIRQDAASERVLQANEHLVVAVPFAARWPYEVHVRFRRHGLGRLVDMAPAEAAALAGALRDLVTRYDGLFGFELPYMMAVLEAPDAPSAADWHLAVEFYPPHRNARQLKIRASVETATGLFINDTEPEVTAAELRAAPVEPVPEARPPVVVRA